MDLQPETEPGSPPMFASSGHRNLNEMSIPELVSVLRADLDRVEGVLVARYFKHKTEIWSLQEKIEVERLMRLRAEEKLKKREEQHQKLKMAQESYEALSKEGKKSGLPDKNTIEELRIKNSELELENLKLMEWKRKWVDDNKAIAELKNRVGELENEKLEPEAEKKSWIDDKNALAALRIRCTELEDANKKNLATIEKLRVENCKLEDEKIKAEAKLLKNVYDGSAMPEKNLLEERLSSVEHELQALRKDTKTILGNIRAICSGLIGRSVKLYPTILYL